MDFEAVVKRMAAQVVETLGLDVHPDELLHDFDGELERKVDEAELGEAGW